MAKDIKICNVEPALKRIGEEIEERRKTIDSLSDKITSLVAGITESLRINLVPLIENDEYLRSTEVTTQGFNEYMADLLVKKPVLPIGWRIATDRYLNHVLERTHAAFMANDALYPDKANRVNEWSQLSQDLPTSKSFTVCINKLLGNIVMKGANVYLYCGPETEYANSIGYTIEVATNELSNIEAKFNELSKRLLAVTFLNSLAVGTVFEAALDRDDELLIDAIATGLGNIDKEVHNKLNILEGKEPAVMAPTTTLTVEEVTEK